MWLSGVSGHGDVMQHYKVAMSAQVHTRRDMTLDVARMSNKKPSNLKVHLSNIVVEGAAL